ncbi:MAG: hypothetical protein Q9176_007652 [Flavoplaca citrina]
MRIQPHQERETSSELGLKLDEVQARYGQIQAELESGGPKSLAYAIRQRFETQLRHKKSRVPKDIPACICLNFGSFTSPKYEELCKQKNRPMYHLAAFQVMKGVLDSYMHRAIAPHNVAFHDPEMNDEDKMFLETILGYRTIRTENVKNWIKHDIFAYIPCATFEYIHSLILEDWPAVFVGVDFEEWPEQLKSKPEHDAVKKTKLEVELATKMKIFRESFKAYSEITCRQKLLVMKESYLFPTVTAYCKIVSGKADPQD